MKKLLNTQGQEKFKKAILANAIFSGISGLAFSLFSSQLAEWMGLSPSWILLILGIGLIGFAGLLVSLTRKASITYQDAFSIIGSDISWVLGSVVLLIGFPNFLSASGNWFVAGVALVVSGFTYLQYHATRSLS